MDTVQNVFGLKPPAFYKSIHKPAEVSNPDLVVGCELEIEELHDGVGYYMEIAGQAWNVVEDGSLRPRGRAWEFVSKPMPLGVFAQELRLLLGKMRLGPANYSDRTSVHVHANVLDFTQEQLATLCLIYVVIEDVLFRFVNRYRVDEAEHPDGMCRDTNIYCVPWSQCRMNTRLIERLLFNPGEVPANWQKYSALNLIPVQTQGTVEWRHLHGTNDMDKLLKWLNVIGSIMQYAKNTPFDEVITQLKRLNDVSTYQQFFQSIVGTHIPYSEDYRRLLADGCINAKYSLINWEPMKKAGAKMQPVKPSKKPMRFLPPEDELEVVEEQALQRLREAQMQEIARRAARPAQVQAQVAGQGLGLNRAVHDAVEVAPQWWNDVAQIAPQVQPAPANPIRAADPFGRNARPVAPRRPR
jgi:hypothetical protein